MPTADPGRPGAVVAAAYLALSAPLLVFSSTASWGIVAAHLAAFAGVLWATRAGPRNVLADWLPLLLTAFFYAELPHLIAAVGRPETLGYRDGIVQGWEQALFAAQPARELAGQLPWTWLSELLHGGYLSYYFLIVGPPLVFYLAGRRDQFAGAQLAVLATFVVCYVVFIVFPVEGPRYAWPAPPGAPGGPIRDATLRLLEGGSSRGTAFPSSHAAVGVAATLAALRYRPWLGAACAVATLLLVVGAVYGGFHYAVDMAVGVGVGLLASGAALFWYHRRPRRA